jgi:hypothetical protein
MKLSSLSSRAKSRRFAVNRAQSRLKKFFPDASAQPARKRQENLYASSASANGLNSAPFSMQLFSRVPASLRPCVKFRKRPVQTDDSRALPGRAVAMCRANCEFKLSTPQMHESRTQQFNWRQRSGPSLCRASHQIAPNRGESHQIAVEKYFLRHRHSLKASRSFKITPG